LIEVRPARLPQDAAAILAIDRGFHTDTVLAPVPTRSGVEFTTVDDRVVKTFPLDDLNDPQRPWDAAWVAVKRGTICAFAAAGFESWNRRLVLWRLYVDRPHRGQGLARALLEAVEAHARALDAAHMWLETSNQNLPGMEAYRALGFELTGFDLTLYDATPAEGEFALFFSRPVD
jgi:ribosomal protein S18 acetylase RimI-like enzyme